VRNITTQVEEKLQNKKAEHLKEQQKTEDQTTEKWAQSGMILVKWGEGRRSAEYKKG